MPAIQRKRLVKPSNGVFVKKLGGCPQGNYWLRGRAVLSVPWLSCHAGQRHRGLAEGCIRKWTNLNVEGQGNDSLKLWWNWWCKNMFKRSSTISLIDWYIWCVHLLVFCGMCQCARTLCRPFTLPLSTWLQLDFTFCLCQLQRVNVHIGSDWIGYRGSAAGCCRIHWELRIWREADHAWHVPWGRDEQAN